MRAEQAARATIRMTFYKKDQKRGWDPLWLAKALSDPARPVFLMGSVPPREGTLPDEARPGNSAPSAFGEGTDEARGNAGDRSPSTGAPSASV